MRAPTFSLAGTYANNCQNPRETIVIRNDGTAIATYKQQSKKLSWQQEYQSIIFTDDKNNKIVARINENGDLALDDHPKLKTADKYVPLKELVRYRCN
ncbi:MAG: hypothetical protein ACK5LE_08430 [Alphaproteobacteria bacterium]